MYCMHCTYIFFTIVPILNVSLSSNASTVLDISGYNSFTLQCSGKVNPIITQSQESFSFKLTKNGLPVTKSPSISSTANLSLTLFQNSSIQQNASLGPDSLIYNCTVRFSVSGSIIATNSSTTKIIVKGELKIGSQALSHVNLPSRRSLATSSSSSTPTTSNLTNISSDTMECS